MLDDIDAVRRLDTADALGLAASQWCQLETAFTVDTGWPPPHIYVADFVSIYPALLNGLDPTPLALVDKLKQTLA